MFDIAKAATLIDEQDPRIDPIPAETKSATFDILAGRKMNLELILSILDDKEENHLRLMIKNILLVIEEKMADIVSEDF